MQGRRLLVLGEAGEHADREFLGMEITQRTLCLVFGLRAGARLNWSLISSIASASFVLSAVTSASPLGSIGICVGTLWPAFRCRPRPC